MPSDYPDALGRHIPYYLKSQKKQAKKDGKTSR